MIKVKLIQDEDVVNQSKHKQVNLTKGFTYKAKKISHTLYMIWLGKKYQGVFNRNNFKEHHAS